MPGLTHRYELLRQRLGLFTRMLHDVEAGQVRAVHQTRVASRRLRELLPVLQIDSDLARGLGRRLRRVTRRLGVVRELDVLLALIDELRASDFGGVQALDRVRAVVEERRAEARKGLAEKVSTTQLRRLAKRLDDVARRLEDVESEGKRRNHHEKSRAWRWAIEARVARRAARLRSAIDEAGSVYLPERLHTVRIAAKKLRYAVELSAAIGVANAGANLRLLKQAQDALGRLRELHVLVEATEQVRGLLTPPDVTAWRQLGRLVDAVEDECRRLHARYLRLRGRLIATCGRLGRRDRAAAPRPAATDREAAG